MRPSRGKGSHLSPERVRAFAFTAPWGFVGPRDSHACRTPWSVFQDGSDGVPTDSPPTLRACAGVSPPPGSGCDASGPGGNKPGRPFNGNRRGERARAPYERGRARRMVSTVPELANASPGCKFPMRERAPDTGLPSEGASDSHRNRSWRSSRGKYTGRPVSAPTRRESERTAPTRSKPTAVPARLIPAGRLGGPVSLTLNGFTYS